jgi:dTDP-4-amino-4,6-dideoxygalactose transaminase
MNPHIPVFAFVRDAELDRALDDAATRVVSRQQYVLGEEVEAFEREFAAYCGARHCVGVANGTDALELALRALGIRNGSHVATVANAGYYTCTALDAIGATPVFIDIDETLTMSPPALAAEIANVDAIVVTHLYGRLAAIEAIRALAARRNVPVIEDCAQAHGASRDGVRAGAFGTAGCFSFYPTKNLGALGDGGAVVTSSGEVASHVRALRQYGWSAKYRVELAGGRNSRLDELQAAFLRVKLPRLGAWNGERAAIARRYCVGLNDLGFGLPRFEGEEHVAHLFVLRAQDREDLRAHLTARGIATGIHYPIPDHRQAVRSSLPRVDLPVTEVACGEVLTLPCFPGLAGDQVDRVIESIRDYRHISARR